MITEPMDLRTGRSVWEANRAPKVPRRTLDRDMTADVLVVGAGISGAMLADTLSTSGLKVIVVDRRGPAEGSTTASTALVQYEIDTPLIELSKKIGKADAVRAYRRSRLAVDAITARLEEVGVPDVVRRNGLYLAGDELDPDGLRKEHDARMSIGLSSCYLDRKALRERFGISRAAAIMGYGNLTIDPRLATRMLLREASTTGTTIVAPAQIVDIKARRSGVTAIAGNGRRIHCKSLVFATGYELPKSVPQRGHTIVSTWAIGTKRQPRKLWPEQVMIWEASETYLYMRTTPDGRVVCGGEDEEFSDEGKRDALLGRKTKAIERKLGKMFPQLDTRAEFAWTGCFGQSETGLPRIGRVPGMENCWVSQGFGGNGTTYSRIAADIIGGALIGRPDVDSDLYDFKPKRR